jgi:hypothetical protein
MSLNRKVLALQRHDPTSKTYSKSKPFNGLKKHNITCPPK